MSCHRNGYVLGWCAGLGSVPSNLDRFRESELIHCRWAMAGAAGVIAVELLGQGNWFEAPLWVCFFRHL
jgi:hypothetical protein